MSKRTKLCYGTLLSVLFVVATGCVNRVGPPDGNETGSDQLVFAEDADETIAALPFVEDELLVQPFPGADPQALADLYTQVGATEVGALSDVGVTVLRVSPDNFYAAAQQLAQSGLIESVQKNYLYEPTESPDDPFFSQQAHLTQINAPNAWQTTVGSEAVIIAIVDTGVDGDHPDLTGKILDGWNVYDDNADYGDVQGHGTLVAGVAAAATNNGVGVAGVTWECPLLAIRVADQSGRSSARHLAAGILWAVEHDAAVINVSFAPLWSNRVVQAAAQQAFNRGRIVVISSGNGGGTATDAGYQEAIFVGALTASNTIAGFSDCGPFLDITAPGTGILSTGRGGEYGLANGTSFAAPIVSGIAALAWSVNPELRPVSIEQAIVTTAVDLGTTGKDSTYGYGAVDAAATVAAAGRMSFTPDTTPPTLNITRPTQGATLSGRYTVTATASDDWGLADVVLAVDGMPYATDTRTPFRFVIDTAQFSSGTHELSLVATDLSGNASPEKTVTVTFQSSATTSGGSASAITFTSPAGGAAVSGDVNIQATITDSDGLAAVEWFVDEESVLVNAVSGRSSGVAYTWRTASAARGPHTIALVVTDAEGNVTTGDIELNKR